MAWEGQLEIMAFLLACQSICMTVLEPLRERLISLTETTCHEVDISKSLPGSQVSLTEQMGENDLEGLKQMANISNEL